MYARKCTSNCTRLLTHGHIDRTSQFLSMALSQPAWLTLSSILSRCSQLQSMYALKYTPNYTQWHSPSRLDNTHPNMLSGRSQLYFQYAPRYIAKYILKYTQVWCPGRPQLHSMAHSLPGWLSVPKSARKTLPITLLFTLPSTLPIALDDTLPAWFKICSQVSTQGPPTYTPSTLPSPTPSMFSSTLLGMVYRMLPIGLDGTLPACMTVHSQVSSQDALYHSTEHARKYTADCTICHTASVLDYMLPSDLSGCSQSHPQACSQVHSQLHPTAHSQPARRDTLTKSALKTLRRRSPSTLPGTHPSPLQVHSQQRKTLPISLDYLLTCILLHAQCRDLLSCRCQALHDVRLLAYGGHSLVGGGLRVACGLCRVAGGRWPAPYVGQYHDVGQDGCRNLISSVAPRRRSHDAWWSWCWRLQPQIVWERYTLRSQGEQISDSVFSAESAAFYSLILGLSVDIWSRADGDNCDGDDGDGVYDGDGDGDGTKNT